MQFLPGVRGVFTSIAADDEEDICPEAGFPERRLPGRTGEKKAKNNA
jgi:hypothetical protein